MAEAEIEGILTELDAAYEELETARTRLAELLPMSATKPGDSGQARVDFVTGAGQLDLATPKLLGRGKRK